MKRLAKVIGSLVALALTVVSLQSIAETKLGGRDFNHNTTGFPLSGGHATAACETCHVGGVFKGTPKICDDCHAVGKRVLATPKSSTHIVTDAPCESCHFNTSTWLGARFNHGSAQPGKCATCHNSRQATGKPTSHNVGRKATESCDSCHRTFAWLPATWNHVGVAPGTCTTCHNDSTATGLQGAAALGTPHTTIAKSTFQCDECHSFIGWIPAAFKHNKAGTCSSCHDGSTAVGKPTSHSPTAIKGINPCEDCHRSTSSWLPASYAHSATSGCTTCHDGIKSVGKPTSHSATAIKGINPCEDCHRSTSSWLPASFTHTATGSCSTCHDGVKAVGKNAGHIATTDDCGVCHTSTTTWSGALGAKPSNHIPYNSGVACSACHIGTGIATGPTMHTYVSASPCITCHLKSGTSYLGGMDKKDYGHKGFTSGDCSQSGCHAPAGRRGTAYINWD